MGASAKINILVNAMTDKLRLMCYLFAACAGECPAKMVLYLGLNIVCTQNRESLRIFPSQKEQPISERFAVEDIGIN